MYFPLSKGVLGFPTRYRTRVAADTIRRNRLTSIK